MVAAVYIPRVTLGLGHTLPESRIALRAANFLKCQNKTANKYSFLGCASKPPRKIYSSRGLKDQKLSISLSVNVNLQENYHFHDCYSLPPRKNRISLSVILNSQGNLHFLEGYVISLAVHPKITISLSSYKFI